MPWRVPRVLALCLVPCLLLLGCTTLPRTGEHRGLRVMTYNIQYGGGGQRLAEVIAAIRAEAPDVVALQEVDVHWSPRSGFEDQATAIARALDMQVRFAPIYDLADTARGGRRQFGVALLTRHPIVAFTNHAIARLSTQDSAAVMRAMPGFLAATLDVGGMPVRVFNTHLDYRRDPAVRRRQVADMLGVIGSADTATILFGDLNAPPSAPELAPLLSRLRDAWPASGDPGHTIPATGPDRRIDYILVSPHFTVRRAWVPATQASDHRPVVAELVASRIRS